MVGLSLLPHTSSWCDASLIKQRGNILIPSRPYLGDRQLCCMQGEESLAACVDISLPRCPMNNGAWSQFRYRVMALCRSSERESRRSWEPAATIVTFHSHSPILPPGTEAVLINDGVIISSVKQFKISLSHDSII
jgi:hypothetical protein